MGRVTRAREVHGDLASRMGMSSVVSVREGRGVLMAASIWMMVGWLRRASMSFASPREGGVMVVRYWDVVVNN